MTRTTYLYLITLLFALVYLPSLINTILFSVLKIDTIDFSSIPKTNIKTILIFFIAITESSFIKKQYPGIIGWILTIALFCGIVMRISYLPWADTIVIVSLVLLLLNLIVYSVIERNKSLINYLLFTFIVLRMTIILTRHNNTLWLLDLGLGNLIVLIGVVTLIRRAMEHKKSED